MIPVTTFGQFEAAITAKLQFVLDPQQGDIPEPATMTVFGLGALVAGGVYRRNRKGQAKAA